MAVLSRKSITFIFFGTTLMLLLIIASGAYFVFAAPQTVIRYLETIIPEETPAPLQVKGVGIIGDSISDEYRGDDNRGLTYAPTTLNWVEQLVKYRDIDVGEWGSWGEPRRGGYAYNWSRTGATVNSMLESGQHTGVAEQVKNGKVNVVIVYIGANDYIPYLTNDGYDAIYNGTISDPALLRKQNRLVADITTAVDTVRAAGNAKILLMKIPDWGNLFGVRVAFPIPEQRQRVSNSIASVNRELERVAAERNIPTLDPNSFYTEVFGNNASEITIGGKRFNALLPGDDPKSIFLEDGIHSGTVFNGLFANYVLNGMNQKLGTSFRLFSQQEIFSIAGI